MSGLAVEPVAKTVAEIAEELAAKELAAKELAAEELVAEELVAEARGARLKNLALASIARSDRQTRAGVPLTASAIPALPPSGSDRQKTGRPCLQSIRVIAALAQSLNHGIARRTFADRVAGFGRGTLVKGFQATFLARTGALR